MKNIKLRTLIFVVTTLNVGCTQNASPIKSEFKVENDYYYFSSRMSNNDTLNINVNLSICAWLEYDKLQITKSNDSVYLQLQEKGIAFVDELMNFSKVHYDLKTDTLNLEKMMLDFDINHQKKSSSPFFIIVNPKETDTLLLRTTGLGNRGDNIERYQKIIEKLYPNEMSEYRRKYRTPPPPPPPIPDSVEYLDDSEIDNN